MNNRKFWKLFLDPLFRSPLPRWNWIAISPQSAFCGSRFTLQSLERLVFRESLVVPREARSDHFLVDIVLIDPDSSERPPISIFATDDDTYSLFMNQSGEMLS